MRFETAGPGIRLLAVAGFAALAAITPAAADPLVGTWLTPRDSKGVVAHIDVATCETGVCGVIARTYDMEDHPVHTRNLGVRVFWDMLPVAANRWEGMAFVPLYKQTYKGQIEMTGSKIKVGGCFGPICKSQTWTRVR